MNEYKKSEVLVLIVLTLLFLITPLLPSSMRPAYLYVIFNFLIIFLGAEAGLLSAFSRPLEDKTQSSTTQKPVMPQEAIPEERDASSTNGRNDISEHNEKLSAFSGPLEDKTQSSSTTQKPVMPQEDIPEERDASSTNGGNDISEHYEKKHKAMEVYSPTEKIVSVTKGERLKKCPSKPSLFFIESEETEAEAMDEEVEAEEEIGGINGQELCAKAEAFIGNFYKQLKMQREESWRKIHEFYQKAF